MNLPTDKFVVATNKDNNKTLQKPEFAGYIKRVMVLIFISSER